MSKLPRYSDQSCIAFLDLTISHIVSLPADSREASSFYLLMGGGSNNFMTSFKTTAVGRVAWGWLYVYLGEISFFLPSFFPLSVFSCSLPEICLSG